MHYGGGYASLKKLFSFISLAISGYFVTCSVYCKKNQYTGSININGTVLTVIILHVYSVGKKT